MWEMLVGAPPFRANVHRELLNAHVAKPPPLQQLSHLPASLQAVVARLLSKDREARFADAGALVRALENCREQVLRGDSPAPRVADAVDESMAVNNGIAGGEGGGADECELARHLAANHGYGGCAAWWWSAGLSPGNSAGSESRA